MNVIKERGIELYLLYAFIVNFSHFHEFFPYTFFVLLQHLKEVFPILFQLKFFLQNPFSSFFNDIPTAGFMSLHLILNHTSNRFLVIITYIKDNLKLLCLLEYLLFHLLKIKKVVQQLAKAKVNLVNEITSYEIKILEDWKIFLQPYNHLYNIYHTFFVLKDIIILAIFWLLASFIELFNINRIILLRNCFYFHNRISRIST